MKEKEPEVWKDIPGYEGLYQVSNWGRVKSFPKSNHFGIILKNKISIKGYLNVYLYLNGKKSGFQVHRLVAQAFIPNPNNYPLVMHLNDIRDDNYYKNLQFGTDKMNNDDKEKKGRGNQPKGEKHYFSKLTEKEILEIRAKYIPRKYSTIKLAKEYLVHHSTILKIVKREVWTHV